MSPEPRFSVYKSSAGSGKTFTLVLEYITLALQDPAYFRHILAITFTNKAANEMKQRVLHSLMHFSDQQKFGNTAAVRQMLPRLSERNKMTARQIEVRAGEVLTQILHHYDDFALRTIDSFVARIIRTFAHDLHLPADFDIELDTDLLIDHAYAQMLEKIGIDKKLTKILVEYTQSKLEDEMGWKIETQVKKASKLLFNEKSYAYLEKLRSIDEEVILNTAKTLRKQIKEFENKIMSLAEKATQLIRDKGIELSSFANGSNGLGGYFDRVANGNIYPAKQKVVDAVRDNKWISGKCPEGDKMAIEAIKPALTDYFNQMAEIFEREGQDNTIRDMIYANIYQLGVLSAFEREIDEIRTETGTLHISEFNKRITEIIVNEPVPFVYERTGEKYFNYLVDEFQDTSQLQWKNLLPLIGNSLAEGRQSLVVGDAKQAIYRFRNGNVDQFVALPGLPQGFEKRVFGDAEKAMIAGYQQQNLDTNYRSLPEIVKFNNELFAFLSNRLGDKISKIYEGLAQKCKNQDGPPGFVSIEFLAKTDATEYQSVTVEKVVNLIRMLIEEGYSLQHITILTRKNDEASLIAAELMKNGISVISAEALLLSSSAEVNLVVAVMKWLSDRNNRIIQAHILNELKNRDLLDLELVDVFPVNKNQPFDIESVLATAGIGLHANHLLSMPLYDLAEEIIRAFGLNKEGYDIFLQFFLDFVSSVASKTGTHLNDLLQAWEEKYDKLSVIVPQGIDAVQVMTIHKAKGLEFPVVIWPFADSAPNSKDVQFWIEPADPLIPELPVALINQKKELGETKYAYRYIEEVDNEILDLVNLMYVALTRPVQRLYTFSKAVVESKTIHIEGLLYEFIQSNLGSWIADGQAFTRGERSSFAGCSTENGGQNAFSAMNMISSPWQQRIRIARKAVAVPGKVEITSQAWGNLVHKAIAETDKTANADEIVKKISFENQLSQADQSELLDRLMKVLNHPEIKAYFDREYLHLAEKEIITSANEVHRPDRVVLDGDQAVIFEFKTGKPSQIHQQQIEAYANELSSMGYHVNKKLLVYVEEEVKVIAV